MKKLLGKFLAWYDEPNVILKKRREESRKREEEISELRFRIDKLSKSLRPPVYEKGYPSFEAVNREEPKEKKKEDELNGIKAKLLGKKR